MLYSTFDAGICVMTNCWTVECEMETDNKVLTEQLRELEKMILSSEMFVCQKRLKL